MSSWRAKVAERWPYAASVVAVLMFTSMLVGAFVTWQAGGSRLLSFVLAFVDPVLAATLMLALCMVVPELYAGGRFRFPHFVTLPSIYVGTIFMLKSLARVSTTEIQRIEGARRFDSLWSSPRVLLWDWVLLVVILWIIGSLSVMQPSEDVK
ncbi:MAG TPA: hypothetical protein VNI20_13650 [Fimbriimonadaceae bacterium]|nr:hypothetical protein [Fimbriimonadaceae bacterium]